MKPQIAAKLDSTTRKILGAGNNQKFTKSFSSPTTIFLPRKSNIFFSADHEEEKYSNLMQRILLSGSVKVI